MSTDNHGVTAAKMEPWILVDLDCTDRTQQKVYKTGKQIDAFDDQGEVIKDDQGNPIKIDEEKILLQRSEIWTLLRKRKVVGVTKFKPENGETKRTFDLVTGPESKMSWSSIGRIGAEKKFLCTRDKIAPVNIVLGTGEQQQTWIYIGPWKNIPEGKFK
ncbi:MAG TPA: hypothetical protein PKC67_02610 [Kiritimatiellia bacterium]|nr:hypothetical protein [Kiritimatiellia bacterium]HMP33218.1 hypothetical protein [Kiritimatiellia bacterium]